MPLFGLGRPFWPAFGESIRQVSDIKLVARFSGETDVPISELDRTQKKNPLEWEGYAHLSRLGYEQSLLHEQGDASANIDVLMLLGGEWHYWDMKTIERGIHALRKRMTECYSKWERLTDDEANVPDGIDLSMLGTQGPSSTTATAKSLMMRPDARYGSQ